MSVTMRTLTGCGVLLASVLSIVPAVGQEDAIERQRQRIQMLSRISPAVVCVMPPGGQGGGSGVLISPDGYAISNYHVTSGAGNFMELRSWYFSSHFQPRR